MMTDHWWPWALGSSFNIDLEEVQAISHTVLSHRPISSTGYHSETSSQYCAWQPITDIFLTYQWIEVTKLIEQRSQLGKLGGGNQNIDSIKMIIMGGAMPIFGHATKF